MSDNEKPPVLQIDKTDGPPTIVFEEDMQDENVANLTQNIQSRNAMNNLINGIIKNENQELANLNVVINEIVRLILSSLVNNNNQVMENLSNQLGEVMQAKTQGENTNESIQDKKEGEEETA
tara:strand:+ start:1748 stop:2113 length:366 start_codon:yes stop_codon:yes gene_type:complete